MSENSIQLQSDGAFSTYRPSHNFADKAVEYIALYISGWLFAFDYASQNLIQSLMCDNLNCHGVALSVFWCLG